MNDKKKYSALVKQKAKELGFDFCGISKAEFLEEEAPRLEKWLSNNMQGKMNYMENYFDKRLDPRLLVDSAKSVISLLLNYYPQTKQQEKGAPKISKYAYGVDYHFVLKEKCAKLLEEIKKETGEISGRIFVDSAPVMDKVWAKKSGLGWVGKHSNLLNRETGSFFFIAEIICDLELEYDSPTGDFCGTCTKCIDACPTGAIVEPYVVDGSKCISYLTIELKENIPTEFKNKMDNWVFGCDVCQDVCPWNRFSKPHHEPLFENKNELLNWDKEQWFEITEEVFGKVFKDSAVKRTKYKGLKRNLEFLKLKTL
ncbi:MAG: tRNA epoxyqueuosine(34) reductase QueG [Bacteroidia bacterium]|nr:tRNA epoxyqueuosine(34) reductase QueG [Bacteroidia bacterium]